MPNATTKTSDDLDGEVKESGSATPAQAAAAPAPAVAAPAPQEAPKAPKSKAKAAEKDDAEATAAPEAAKRPVVKIRVNETSRWQHIQSAGLMFTPQPRTYAAGLLDEQTLAELKNNPYLTVVETEE